ncbi:MAG: hypothetical protein HOI95_19075 [Chromatiales bacterium]|jgi:hypothetical protein|nr:hypothetical protein [Chromatiales bacterium]
MKAKDEDLRAEYPPDLIKSGVRGKFVKRYHEEGTNLVLIAPDLHKRFPDSDSVNRALREYLEAHGESAT